jgi:hypothetical protein
MTIDSFEHTGIFCIALLFCLLAVGGCGSGTTASAPPSSLSYPFSAGQASTWTQQFGASSLFVPPVGSVPPPEQTITSIATDPTGNVIGSGYVLGSFNGFKNAPVTAYNFLVKFDATGKQLWLNEFGTGSGDFLLGVATDSSGDIYATGITHGALTGFSNPTQEVESVVYKFDAGGSLLWQRQFNIGGVYTYSSGVTVDPLGQVVVAGVYSATGAPTTSNLFFRKLDGGTGDELWTSEFGTSANDFFNGLTSDAAGDLYATVTTTGPFPGTPTGQTNNYLLKLTGSTGAEVWANTLQGETVPYVLPFALTAKDDYVVVGGSAATKSIAVGFFADPSAECFITKYSSADGSTIWNKTFSSGSGDEITGVAVTQSGNVVATGVTNGVFAPELVQPKDDLLLLELTPDGSNLSATQFGVAPITYGSAPVGPVISTGLNGDVFIAGPVQGSYPAFSNPANDIQMFFMNFVRP